MEKEFLIVLGIVCLVAILLFDLFTSYTEGTIFYYVLVFKKMLPEAKIVGKVVFVILAYIIFLIEFPVVIVRVILSIPGIVFSYIANKNMTLKQCLQKYIKLQNLNWRKRNE